MFRMTMLTPKKLMNRKRTEHVKTKKQKKAKENYNVKQSKIAIGSGGVVGKRIFKRNANPGRFCA